MPVETATYISDLNASYPQTSDGVSEGDNHLRLLKAVLKSTFPNVTGAVTGSHTDLNNAVASVNGTRLLTMLAGTVGAPGLAIAGSLTTGLYSPGVNQLAVAIAGVRALLIDASRNVTLDGSLTVAGTTAHTGAVTGPGLMPIGGSMPWFSDTLPTGFGTWAWMNGQSVNATTYAALAAVYPNLVSAGNVVLPDMREVSPIGKYNMGGSGSSPGRITTYTCNTLAGIVGAGTTTLTTSHMPYHNHGGITGYTDVNHTHNYTPTANQNYGVNGGVGAANSGNGGATATGYANQSLNHYHTIPAEGGGAAFNNVHPGLVCNWVMRIA